MKPYLAEVGIEEEQIRALAPGEFFYSANGQVVKIKSRTRKCEHGGATPVSTGETAVPLTKAQFEAAMKKLNSI